MKHQLRPAPLVARLAGHGEAIALVDAATGTSLTYAELAGRVQEMAIRLGTTRRLVLVQGAHTVDAVVAHLGALAGGHVVLLSGDAAIDSLALAYRPDVVIGEELTEVRTGTAHDLHPDLALLLSTSGSTGSPKLVRLSHDNVLANAEAIADYLSLRPGDVAATTLPMHYCYGLSVLHSHLVAGAALLLTDRSVLEPEFWSEFRERGATSFAGVPHTFELLDRIGFADMDLPSLRYVTQAGGKLAPADVRRHAELGRRRGWDLFVMYGQTEATARMAYLPPDLVLDAPEAIGIPIPGGAFHLEPLPERPLAGGELAVGELVYDGPNVMLGYAESAADLARGRDLEHLHTGDVARLRADGLYEVIGRRSRFTKVFGLRIDLDHVERVLAQRGIIAAAADGGDHLVLAVCDGARPVDVRVVQQAAREELHLPPAGVHVATWAEIPRLPSGKVDYRRIVERDHEPVADDGRASIANVQKLYADLLGREARPTDSFVGLGGDSLSYVEVSLRLERLLGDLPAGWHTQSIAALVDRPSTGRRWGSRVETGLLLRALAMVSIVGVHTQLWGLEGGAHLLLAAVGFNLARFQLTQASRGERARSLAGSALKVAVPSVLVLWFFCLWNDYDWPQVLLVDGWTDSPRQGWHYWFLESYVHILLAIALLIAVLDRVERRWPFAFPLGVVAFGALSPLPYVPAGRDVILVGLGWAIARAEGWQQRVLVSGLVVGLVPGCFDRPVQALYVGCGMLLLVWVRSVRVPLVVARVAAVLAAASLWIYLVHFETWPLVIGISPWLAAAVGLASGIVVHQAAERLPVRAATERLRASFGEWTTARHG